MDDSQASPPSTDDNQVERRRRERAWWMEDQVSGDVEVLLKARTVFPFTLMPATVKVEREKVIILYRVFFMVVEIISIRIDDMLSVAAYIGPILEPVVVNYLPRRDALKLKRMLDVCIIARQHGMDLSVLPRQELIDTFMALGADASRKNN